MTRCTKCNCEVEFSNKYDAKYCPKCNIWLEITCDDKDCIFCKERTDKPIKQ